MKVEFRSAAQKALRRLPSERRRQIVMRIATVASAGVGSADVRRLAGSDLYRLRVGDYRVLFTIDPGKEVLTVDLVRTRGDVHKR
ncbi:MAG: type II toxin-antitoxin system RelE family toxin [Thiohalocapsa sp.]